MIDSTDTSQSGELQAARPTGPAAAAMLAAGIGSLVMGLVTTLSEASAGVADALQWKDSVGPLSGKTLIAAAVFFVSWIALYVPLRRRNPSLTGVFWVSLIMIALGVLGTLPTFFELFVSE